jgi:hypothetical protein
MANTITERELATILAALRYWQVGYNIRPAHRNIATNDGEFIPLTHDDIDMLAERLNFGGTK